MISVHVQDFARLPWQNQPSQSASTLAGPLSGSSIPVSAPYASSPANGPAFNGGHSQAVLGNGGLHHVAELAFDDLNELRGQTSLRLSLSFSDLQHFRGSIIIRETSSNPIFDHQNQGEYVIILIQNYPKPEFFMLCSVALISIYIACICSRILNIFFSILENEEKPPFDKLHFPSWTSRHKNQLQGSNLFL